MVNNSDSRNKLFFKHLAQTSHLPPALEIIKGVGNYLFDKTGKRYLDFISGICVNNIGHLHPAIVNAIRKQLDKYLHVMVYGEYDLAPQTEYAAALCNCLPPALNSVFFTNSGSEAVDGAIKLARRYNERYEIISFSNAYHGSTYGAISVAGDESRKNAFRPIIPAISILPFNDIEVLSQITAETSAVIIEPIQGEAGVKMADTDYLIALRKKTEETGTLLIFDEIQTGFGRTGKLFAFEYYNVVPDVLLLGKAMGGGLPLSAFISDKKIMDCFGSNPPLGHITTFGGNPLACAAGLGMFTELIEGNLLADVSDKCRLLKEKLNHPQIIELRGTGLMFALQLANEEKCQAVINHCLDKGLILDWFLYNPSAIRLAPPLTISREEISFAAETIISALA